MGAPIIGDKRIAKAVERIVERYAPDQVILFGSYAYGAPDEHSDLDLLIVKREAEGGFYDRWRDVQRAVEDMEDCPPVQAHVLTPRGVERRLNKGDHFIEDILDKGIVLYGRATYRRPRHTKEMDRLYAEHWLTEAERNLNRLRLLLDHDDEGAAFELQQGIEKLLKAYLISKGWRLARTHDLVGLLDEAAQHDESLAAYRDICAEISRFYIGGRYPMEPEDDPLEGKPLTTDWVQRCYDAATPLIEFARRQISVDDAT